MIVLTHKALGSIPNTALASTENNMPVIPALEKCRQEDQKFKVILGYTVSSRPTWAT